MKKYINPKNKPISKGRGLTEARMALGNLKQGRGAGHFSPMQLLVEVGAGYSWANEACALLDELNIIYWKEYKEDLL